MNNETPMEWKNAMTETAFNNYATAMKCKNE